MFPSSVILLTCAVIRVTLDLTGAGKCEVQKEGGRGTEEALKDKEGRDRERERKEQRMSARDLDCVPTTLQKITLY